MFVGRAAELELLEDQYARTRSAFVPIYGRRRIGKSELIVKFLGGKPAIYHVGKTAPAQLQLRELLEQAAVVLDEPLLRNLPADDWRGALDQITRRAVGKKLVLALDEFQWLAHATPHLPSILQEFWDTRWSKSNSVMLILCGSYVGFMEREVLGKKSPLFGRRTAQIRLAPFPYWEARAFHARWSVIDQARAYFLLGGVPQYLKAFDPQRSLEGNIETAILDEFAPLFREPEFLLREELREIDGYYAVLMAVAEGHSDIASIGDRSALPTRSLPYYLQQLINLGYLGRRYPLTEGKPHARQVRFVVEDPLLRFWFRFVFPNLSYLQQMGPSKTFRERIRPELPSYFGSCFERLCREAIPLLYKSEGLSATFAVGEYWDKSVQIDGVALRDDNWVDLMECKWGPIRSAKSVEQELKAKVPQYPNKRNATIGLRVFSNHAAKGSSDEVKWTTLEELYRLSPVATLRRADKIGGGVGGG